MDNHTPSLGNLQHTYAEQYQIELFLELQISPTVDTHMLHTYTHSREAALRTVMGKLLTAGLFLFQLFC